MLFLLNTCRLVSHLAHLADYTFPGQSTQALVVALDLAVLLLSYPLAILCAKAVCFVAGVEPNGWLIFHLLVS